MRAACASCGAWTDSGMDAASWDARRAEFDSLHRHIPGSPVVLRSSMTEADRDAYTAVAAAKGYVVHQFTPVGGAKLAVFVSRPAAASIRAEGVERLYVTSPDELAARLQ